ncbi:hypothetical protein VP01_4453g1, partial [Puccinia sorghi]
HSIVADFTWLVDELCKDLVQDPLGRGQPLSIGVQVGAGLYQLAHGSLYVTIGNVFSIANEAADKASGQFLNAILKEFRFRTSKFLFLDCFSPAILMFHPGFPSLDSEEEWRVIVELFERQHRIPQVVGAVDGTRIPIMMPPDDNWKSYINRKSWALGSFQCLVDGKGNFHNISGGGAGSIHDSRLRCSLIGQSLKAGATVAPMIPCDTFLVGDTVHLLWSLPMSGSIISPVHVAASILTTTTSLWKHDHTRKQNFFSQKQDFPNHLQLLADRPCVAGRPTLSPTLQSIPLTSSCAKKS